MEKLQKNRIKIFLMLWMVKEDKKDKSLEKENHIIEPNTTYIYNKE